MQQSTIDDVHPWFPKPNFLPSQITNQKSRVYNQPKIWTKLFTSTDFFPLQTANNQPKNTRLQSTKNSKKTFFLAKTYFFFLFIYIFETSEWCVTATNLKKKLRQIFPSPNFLSIKSNPETCLNDSLDMSNFFNYKSQSWNMFELVCRIKQNKTTKKKIATKNILSSILAISLGATYKCMQ